jgi:uncharacterized membrane protein
MLALLRDPAIYALLAALCGAIGIELPEALWTHILEAVAAVLAVAGIVRGMVRARSSTP